MPDSNREDYPVMNGNTELHFRVVKYLLFYL